MKTRLLAEENRKWWTLASVSFALFMIMLDNTVVNVALPTIQEDLGIDVAELEWVVTGYALSFAVLMLTGGKVADMFGRRRVFLIGLAVFTLASLLCGLAGNAELLIAARVLQGVGAACMMPATLSIITATFPPRERGAALGIWAGVSAMALAIGPLVGGLITEHIGWNWIFFINVPIGLVGLVAARLIIPESKDTSKEQRLDLPGLVTSGIALFALVYALIEANSKGWTSPLILGLFAVSLVFGTAFVILELRQRLPMFDMTLFRNPTFAGANTVALLVSLAMFGVFFFISLFMQNVLGYSAVRAGAAFLPMTVLIIVVAPFAGKASDRLGSRWLMTGGMTLVAICLLVFAQLQPDSSYLSLLPGMILGGLGMAITMTPDDRRRSELRPRRQGRRRLGDAEHVPPGRWVARHRGDGRDPRERLERCARERLDGAGGVHGRPPQLPLRRGADRLRRLVDRARHRSQPRAAALGTPRLPSIEAGMTEVKQARLPAVERRAAIVAAALEVFGSGSYSGSTTAEIARAACVSEPIIYRHFPSKRELWFACLDEAWLQLRVAIELKVAAMNDTERPVGCRCRRTVAVGESAAPEPLAAGRHRGGGGRGDPGARPGSRP